MANHDATKVARIAGLIHRHHPENLAEAAGVARLILDDLAENTGPTGQRLELFRAMTKNAGGVVVVPYRGHRVDVFHGIDGVSLSVATVDLGLVRSNARSVLAAMRDLDDFLSLLRDRL